MPVTVKQLSINTEVQTSEKSTKGAKGGGRGLSKAEKEVIIQECLARVERMLENKLRR